MALDIRFRYAKTWNPNVESKSMNDIRRDFIGLLTKTL